ncbi:hypothetical protein [Brochothrix thermosphacta]|uniref:hypothetical protein n=1 Tax=Brochothrix thermosphacta TaxID=2756 RepID=UPI0039B0319B
MNLFKERCKELLGGILFVITLSAAIALVAWLMSLSHFTMGILFVLVLLLPVGVTAYGIYWLFVEPFRKTKEDK